MKSHSSLITTVGVEPAGAASMQAAFTNNHPTALASVDTFVDGAAVGLVGKHTFDLCRTYLDQLQSVAEGQVCSAMIELYQKDGIVTEPAGALSIAALEGLVDTHGQSPWH